MSEIVFHTEDIDVEVEEQVNTISLTVEETPQVLLLDSEGDPVLVITQPPSTKVVVRSPGPQGPDGRGIVSVERTAGSGVPGTYDTYTITYSDGTTSTFQIYNGADGGGSGESLAVHIADETPHPAYDDMIDLSILFENGLV